MFTQQPDAPPARPGSEVLDETAVFLARFIAFPSDAARDAVCLWTAHTHVTEACDASARLAVLSDLPGSGKTMVLELAALLSRNASLEADITGPALVGIMSQGAHTVLLDECDQYWGRNGGESYRQLRTVVNSGYRQGAAVSRRSAGGYRKDPIYGAIAMAGLGSLPGSVLSRCLVVRMAKRRPEQTVEHFMPRMHAPLGAALGDALGSWARSVALDIATAWPDIPERITDRQAEIWGPLIAIADLAGGEWPERARSACVELVLGNEAEPVLSPAQRVLTDLRTIWIGDGTSLPTATIVQRLFALPGSPWSALWTDANAPRELSALLSAYSVRPVRVRDGERVCQGYRRGDLARVWPVQAALTAAPEDEPPAAPDDAALLSPEPLHNPHTPTEPDASPQVTAPDAEPVKAVKVTARRAAPPKRVPAAAAAE